MATYEAGSDNANIEAEQDRLIGRIAKLVEAELGYKLSSNARAALDEAIVLAHD